MVSRRCALAPMSVVVSCLAECLRWFVGAVRDPLGGGCFLVRHESVTVKHVPSAAEWSAGHDGVAHLVPETGGVNICRWVR